MSSDFDLKLARVREMLAASADDALLVTRLDNLCWLGCGLDAHVGLASDYAVATAVITSRDAWLVTTNIEGPRLAAEELGSAPLELLTVPWHEHSVADGVRGLLPAGARVLSDQPQPGAEYVDLAPLRYALLPAEVSAYRAHGADQGAAIGSVAAACRPGESELAIAGRLSAALLERGITPTVLLVAADDRIARFRHPIPTPRTVERCVMLVAGGRRAGLTVSVTRLVHFGPLGTDLVARHRAVTAVDAVLIDQTRVGASVADIFAAGQAAYAAAGFPEEWRHHHQGGATGYAGRDYRATPTCNKKVLPDQAFAWNPSIAGTKSEDTILATPAGPEILSASPGWPLLAVATPSGSVPRADILEL